MLKVFIFDEDINFVHYKIEIVHEYGSRNELYVVNKHLSSPELLSIAGLDVCLASPTVVWRHGADNRNIGIDVSAQMFLTLRRHYEPCAAQSEGKIRVGLG